jgi:hypothetical protein
MGIDATNEIAEVPERLLEHMQSSGRNNNRDGWCTRRTEK